MSSDAVITNSADHDDQNISNSTGEIPRTEGSAEVSPEVSPEVPPKKRKKSWYSKFRLFRRLNKMKPSLINRAICALYLSATANGYISSLSSGLLTLDSFRAMFGIKDRFPSIVYVATSSLLVGAFLSMYLAAGISDYFGRRVVLFTGATIMVLGTIIEVLMGTSGIVGYIVGRFIVGVGLGFNQIAAPTLVAEIAHPSERNAVGIHYNVFWYLGSVLSALSIYVSLLFDTKVRQGWGWRATSAFQGIFPLLQLFYYFGIPESPRWLIAVKDEKGAKKMLEKYHYPNRDSKSRDLLDEELRVIRAALHREEFAVVRSYKSNDGLESYEFQGAREVPQGVFEFFHTWPNFKRLSICIFVGAMIQFAGNGAIGWFLYPAVRTMGFRNQAESGGLNIVLQVWNLIWATIGAIISSKVSRRKLWLFTTFGLIIPLIGMAILVARVGKIAPSGEPTPLEGYTMFIFILMFWAIYDLAYTPLQIGYLQEVLPYRLRSNGVAVNWTAVMGFGVIQQFLTPTGIENMKWAFFLVHAGLLFMFGIIILMCFEETEDITIDNVHLLYDRRYRKELREFKKRRKLNKKNKRKKKGLEPQQDEDIAQEALPNIPMSQNGQFYDNNAVGRVYSIDSLLAMRPNVV